MVMMRASVVVLVAACTHHRPIADVSAVAGDDVTVETYGGESIDVKAEQAPDGLTFRTYGGGYIMPGNVARVVETRNAQGALEGLGIGALVGVVGGAALGYADGDDVCENEGHCILTFSAVDKATIGAVVFGVIGGGIGGAIGLIRGSRYIYSYGEQIRVTP